MGWYGIEVAPSIGGEKLPLMIRSRVTRIAVMTVVAFIAMLVVETVNAAPAHVAATVAGIANRASAMPEPAALLIFASGAFAIAGLLRRKIS